MRKLLLTAAMLAVSAFPLRAAPFVAPDDEDEANFIADEIIATFYHELGHGLIHVLNIPVLGKEEDAADNLSVILMNDIWDEKSATEILTHDATAYALRAADPASQPDEGALADVHSLDIQRYYSVVCLFYGANPDQRKQLATDLKLPAEKFDSCPGEYQEVANSWSAVLQGTDPAPDKKGLVMAPGQDGQWIADILADEVKSLNEKIGLPEQISVKAADCGEANAFFNPEDDSITLCNEYAEDLKRLWEKQ